MPLSLLKTSKILFLFCVLLLLLLGNVFVVLPPPKILPSKSIEPGLLFILLVLCIFSGITCLLFPVSLLISITFEIDNIIFVFIRCAFLLYVLVISYFRVYCYYIQFILAENGKGFLNKCKIGFVMYYHQNLINQFYQYYYYFLDYIFPLFNKAFV